MSDADRQAVLESIAFGADATISARDRIRAIELLDAERLNGGRSGPVRETSELNEEDFDGLADSIWLPILAEETALREGRRFPETSAALRRIAEQLAQELVDAERSEPEKERARRLATQLCAECAGRVPADSRQLSK